MASDGHGIPEPPRRDLDVPVTPLAARGRSASSRVPILLALAIFGCVLAAIALARVFPAAPERPVPVLPSAAEVVPASPAGDEPRPTATDLPPIPRLPAQAVVERVLDGSLDGYLVYADATLRDGCGPGAAAPCSPAPVVEGLGLDVVAGDAARDGLDVVPDQAVLVLAVRGPRLEYLGSLVASPHGSPPLSSLPMPGGSTGTTDSRDALADVSGWLVVRPACIIPVGDGSATCAPTPPFLADDPPLPGGLLRSDRGTVVALADPAWGVDPAVDPVSEGPFLVRPHAGGDPTWEVVARYDASRSVRVVIP